MKVLLAIDDSLSSEATLQALIAMGRPQEMEVRILHVVELWPVHVHGTEWNRELSVARRAMWTRAEEIVARAARTLENAGFRATTAVKEGDSRTDIIDAASEWPADLIMFGSHGRTGLDRLLMGSVSEAVAPCALLSANRAYRQVLISARSVLGNTSARQRLGELSENRATTTNLALSHSERRPVWFGH